MFERYTERARRVIFFSRYEASQFGSTTIETHHMLLGLMREDKNLTHRFLRNGDPLESIRQEIVSRTTIRPKVSTSVDLPLSNECRRILAYANEEAERLNHRHIGTEHLLLGILREEHCVAAEILTQRGLRLEALREELAHHAHSDPRTPPHPGTSPEEMELVMNLARLGFPASMQHFAKATAARAAGEWKTARAELDLFMDSLVNAIGERSQPEVISPIFKGFDWRLSLREIQSGLPEEEDCRFRISLAVLLAELLLNRFERHT